MMDHHVMRVREAIFTRRAMRSFAPQKIDGYPKSLPPAVPRREPTITSWAGR